MADLLQHPALLAWLHACELSDHINSVFSMEFQEAEWHRCCNDADSLRFCFGKAIPADVWAAYKADCKRRALEGE